MADEESEIAKEKSFKLFWILDVQKTPCARESVLFGSVGALVFGVGHFLATSRVKRSCDWAVGGFIVNTLGSWLYCRYNYAKLRIQQRIVQEGIKNKVMYEGSNIDPTINNNRKNGS